MKFLSLLAVCLVLLTTLSLVAKEYGGRWTDESIREKSLKYIEHTKLRFASRAARLAEVLDGHSGLVEYRELTKRQQTAYDRFLKDRLSNRDREMLMKLLLEDLEDARLKLVEDEKRAYELWEKKPEDRQVVKAAPVQGDVYGTEIVASELGVVLDISPSMQPYVDKVRSEILKSFDGAVFLESKGSGIRFKKGRYGSPDPGEKPKFEDYYRIDSWYYGTIPKVGVNPFDPKWHQSKILIDRAPHYRQVDLERNPAAALIALITLQKVDVVYWFCDFEDENDPASLNYLAEVIKEYEVPFYVHSLKRRPSDELTKIVEDSGGEVIRKRIR